jgi:hypothetical protein
MILRYIKEPYGSEIDSEGVPRIAEANTTYMIVMLEQKYILPSDLRSVYKDVSHCNLIKTIWNLSPKYLTL